MPHRDRRHIETLSGHGWISLDGERLGDATYHIDVWQQFVTLSPGESLPGTKQLSGRIEHALQPDGLFDRVVRLHLESGGYLDCELQGSRVRSAR